jgi:hypothetical protein
MKLENPLATLGIPRNILLRAQRNGDTTELRKLIEANFRTLSKVYHPDLEHGDADLMTGLSSAVQQISDAHAMQYFIEELLQLEDFEQVYRSEYSNSSADSKGSVIYGLLAMLQSVDHFRMLGIGQARSYLSEQSGQVTVVDVTSPVDAVISVYDSREATGNYKRLRSHWHFESYEGPKKKRWFPMKMVVQKESVVVAGVSRFPSDLLTPSQPISHMRLEGTSGADRVQWIDPESCWFLPTLEAAGSPLLNSVRAIHSYGIVVYSDEKFAITGPIVASAFM